MKKDQRKRDEMSGRTKPGKDKIKEVSDRASDSKSPERKGKIEEHVGYAHAHYADKAAIKAAIKAANRALK